MKLTESDIKLLKIVSWVSGIFTMLIIITMIFSYFQLKTINPLDSPVLAELKEQYDKDPANRIKAEQIRAIDLMARKAYFSTRRQIEVGALLLVIGAAAFILAQRLISGNEKLQPVIPLSKPDQLSTGAKYRKYLTGSVIVLTAGAVVSSFLLRSNLPDLSANAKPGKEKANKTSKVSEFKPDKVNYPFFRGEDGRGIAGGEGYPTEWDGEAGTNIKWKVRLPANGKSSPVIWGDKLFVTGAVDRVCEVFCLDKKTGNILWSSSASGIEGEPEELPKMDMESGLAVSTAATNGKYVCAVFANGNLICLDMDGNKVWAKNLGSLANIYGYSSSLIISKDLLIVQYDADEKISLLGFDLGSGEMKWETLRPGRPVWSSPVIADFGDGPEVIINGNPSVSSYNAETGAEKWSVECLTGDVAPSAAVNSSMVYVVTDYARLAAVKPGAGAAIIWEDNTYTPDVSSPVANDEFLFLATANGDVACYNAMKGDTLWARYYLDQFYASPVIADDKVWFLDRSGIMHIVTAGDKYELIAEPALGEETDCTPAFSEGELYIRAKENIYCISEK